MSNHHEVEVSSRSQSASNGRFQGHIDMPVCWKTRQTYTCLITTNDPGNEIQIQEIIERLDVQAEAISRLVELVSSLEGVDAASLKSYPLRLKRDRGHSGAVPKVEAPTLDPRLSTPE